MFPESSFNEIVNKINEILADEDQAKEFLSLIKDHAANIATEQSLAQAKAKED